MAASNMFNLPEQRMSNRSAAEPQTPVKCASHEGLARFFSLRGRRIFEACGALWYSVPGRFLMSLPYQRFLDPDPGELLGLIRRVGAFGVRFPSSSWVGLEGGLYVHRNVGPYELSSLHVKHRPRVRHALQRFEVRQANAEELLSQGHELNLSTMARQGRYDPEFGDLQKWRRLVQAASECQEVEFPAVFSGKRLVAYMVTCREQHWLHILHQMSRHEDLPDFPNHLLTYSVTQRGLADSSLESICYGYTPLFAADGLHEYKTRFGYEMLQHYSIIQLHPTLDGLLNRTIARAAIRVARSLRRNDQRLETVEKVLEGAHLSRRA
jgi:hypothetical protein